MEPLRDNDCRELCRCGMTNSGAGCGVHWGRGIELVDVWRASDGRVIDAALVTWIDAERIGGATLFRGGIAGGGPRDDVAGGGPLPAPPLPPPIEFCDWTRGGTWGNLVFDCSVDDWRDTTLGVRCNMADVTFDMDWVIDDCVWLVACGCTGDTVVVGIWGLMLIIALGWALLLPFDLWILPCWTFAALIHKIDVSLRNKMWDERKPIRKLIKNLSTGPVKSNKS